VYVCTVRTATLSGSLTLDDIVI